MHLNNGSSSRFDRCLFIGGKDISCGSRVADFGHGVLSDTQALDENFSVLVGLKSLVVAVSTCHTEGEALNFSVRGSLDDFERAFLRLIDKTNACFVLYGIGLAVFLDGNTVHAFIKHKAVWSCFFTDEILAVAKLGHLINAALKLSHFAAQLIALIKFAVAVCISIDLKDRTCELVVRIIRINLSQFNISLDKVVYKLDFHDLIDLAHSYSDFFLGEYKTCRAFNFTDYPSAIRYFFKRKTAVIFRCGSLDSIFFCKLSSSRLKDTDNRTVQSLSVLIGFQTAYRAVNDFILNGFALICRKMNNRRVLTCVLKDNRVFLLIQHIGGIG